MEGRFPVTWFSFLSQLTSQILGCVTGFCPPLSSWATPCPRVATSLRCLHLPSPAMPQLPQPETWVLPSPLPCPPTWSKQPDPVLPASFHPQVKNANSSHVCSLALSPLVRFSLGPFRASFLYSRWPFSICLHQPHALTRHPLNTYTPTPPPHTHPSWSPACRVTCNSSNTPCLCVSKQALSSSFFNWLSSSHPSGCNSDHTSSRKPLKNVCSKEDNSGIRFSLPY